jgi:hypothetical protein
MAMEYEKLAKDLEDVRRRVARRSGVTGAAGPLGKRRMREPAQRLRWRRRQQELAARALHGTRSVTDRCR